MKALLTLALLASAVVSNAAIYDFASDFSVTNGNPNGAWSYGYRPTLTAARVSYTATVSDANIQSWYTPGLSSDATPSIFKRIGAGANGVVQGEGAMHSGPNGEASSLLFTSPESGFLTLDSSYGAGDIGGVGIYVLLNGTPVYSRPLTYTSESFNLTTPVPVSIGDTLEVLVSIGDGGYSFDSTPVAARISIQAVPEPATIAMLSLGAAALLRRRRKI